jgi:ankyrin repeat protein
MGHLPTLKILLEKGCHCNLRDNWGYSPLMLACKQGHVELSIYLLDLLPDLTSRANNGDTILHCIAQGGSIPLARAFLFKSPGSVNKRNENDETPCDVSEEYQQRLLLDYFIHLGAKYGDELSLENESMESREKLKIYEKQIDLEKREKDELDAKNGNGTTTATAVSVTAASLLSPLLPLGPTRG